MYELFIGNYERAIGMSAYHKKGNKYIPCTVTGYHFRTRKYTLLSIEPGGRRVIRTKKIYVKTDEGEA